MFHSKYNSGWIFRAEPSNLSGSSQNQENVVAKLTQRVASLEKREARFLPPFLYVLS